MVENLNKEFIVYKSDLLELLHANNKEILTEMRHDSEKLRQELRDETGKLRQEIQKVETRIDKLTYWILGMFGAWSTVMISVSLTFVLHNWK